MRIDNGSAVEFLRVAFQPDDWIAVLLKSYATGRAAQRVVPVSLATAPAFQAWIAQENQPVSTMNAYVGLNAIRPRRTSRRRTDIGAIRHMFLDADHERSAVLAAIAARRDLPPPSYVLQTSPNRAHVCWRVAGFSTERVEALQKQLAHDLGTDPAATSCSQMTRIPGCLNHKTTPPVPVTVEYRCPEATYAPADFPDLRPFPLDVRVAVRSRPAGVSGDASVLERARRYVAALPPAITGQHGDAHTFRVCCRLVRGFALTDVNALAVLQDWNAGCCPPWSERDLCEKLRRARRYGREPVGGLLGNAR